MNFVKHYFTFLVFACGFLGTAPLVQGQVKMGQNVQTIDSSAVLELESTKRGILIPRMSSLQRDSILNPAIGLQIVNTTTNCLQIYFLPGGWQNIYCGCQFPILPQQLIQSNSSNSILWSWTSVTGVLGYKWNDTNHYATALDLALNTSNLESGLNCQTTDTAYVWPYNSCGAALQPLVLIDSSGACCLNCVGNSFAYRRSIGFNNPQGFIKQHQVLLNLTYSANMRSDFADLRFTDTLCSSLSYWIESYVSGTSAKVWVRLDSLPSGQSKIYMYYGNQNAQTQSNEASTFFLLNGNFEQLPAGTGWSVYTSGAGAVNAGFTGDVFAGARSARIFENYRGCLRAYLHQTVTLPNTTPLYLHYKKKHWYNNWGGYVGFKIGGTNFNYNNGTTLSTFLGSGGSNTQNVWTDYWDNISAFAGQTVRIDAFYHDDVDWDPTYCSFGDHGAWLLVDNMSITTQNTPYQAIGVSIGTETNCP